MRLAAESFDVLGEGPVWVVAEGRVYWFDIKGRRLNWLEHDGGLRGAFELPVRASAAAPRSAGGLLLATERGLARFDTATGGLEVVQPFALEPGFRTNDGQMDPQGRFWWSTMDDNGGERPGAVFLTHSDGHTDQVLDDVHIANTLTMTAAGDTLFLADSKFATLFAIDPADPRDRRVFARTEPPIAPDGSALDAEGYLWNAQWGGWRLVRYAPDGSVDRMVEVPVEQPTSCAFGGPDLATLYVTSAREGLSANALADQPYAGCLFALEPGVSGLPLPTFDG